LKEEIEYDIVAKMRMIQHSENILTPQEAAAQFEMLVNYRMAQVPGSFTEAKIAASIPHFVESLKDDRGYIQNRAPTEYFNVLNYILKKIETDPASFVFTEIHATEEWILIKTKNRLVEYAKICGVALRNVSNLFGFLKYPNYSLGPSCCLIADFNTDYKVVSESPEPDLDFELEDESWLNGIVDKPEPELEDYFDAKDRIWLQKTSLKIDFPTNQQG